VSAADLAGAGASAEDVAQALRDRVAALSKREQP
jgi:hypothetical protein